MKHKKIDIPIYYGYLRMIETDDLTKAVKEFNLDTGGTDVSKYGAFYTSSYDEEGIIIHTVAFLPEPSHHLIAHEVVHTVNGILSHVGIKLDTHNDEAQAYLTGWITKDIYEFLEGK